MKVTYSFIAVLLITLFTGCKQDFDITADYKEVPVVYGLLNSQDTIHYIRIQKGYLIDGNALIAAGVSDSIYYPDVITVKLVPFNANGSSGGAAITLTRVDGSAIGLPKDNTPGPFATTPNWLYSFNTGNIPLDPNKNYKLEVTNTSNGYTFSNKKIEDKYLTLVKEFQVNAPYKGGIKINLQSEPSAYNVVWHGAENGGVYDLVVRFYYLEFKLSDNSLYRDTFIDIPFLKSFIPPASQTSDLYTLPFTSDLVLNYLANNVKSDIEVIRQFNILKGMQFKFAAGGVELQKFMESKMAQGGLSSNEALPTYSNIDGGVGLLSSRYFKQIDSVLLSNSALDSLACSSISRVLKFKDSNGNICQ